MVDDKRISDKKPKPNNRELYKKAQEKLISSLVYTDSDITDIFENVSILDFEEPDYQLIYEAIISLSRRGEETDVISIARELESEGVLSDVGGIKKLYTIREAGKKSILQTPISVYAKILVESSAKNKLSNLLDEYKEFFKDDSGMSAADALSDIQSNFNEHLYRLSNDSTIAEVSDLSEKYMDLLSKRKIIAEENSELAEGLLGIPSLLPSMNKYTTGWKANQMITVGAKTGVGKSVYAVNAAVGAVQANKSVMFFSLEMDADEIQDRIVASVTSIPMNELKKGFLNDEHRDILSEALSELKTSNLTIDADAKQTIDSIRAKCLKKAQSPEGLDMVIVDYLQLITPTGRYNSRQEQVADISRNIKLLAKQLQIPIMVLVQLNRAKNDEEEDLPTVDSIRESGAIAQDSDIVILLHRERSLDDELPPTLVILAKQRNGAAGKVIRCHSQLECSMFREIVSRKDHDDEFSDDDNDIDDLKDELEDDMNEFDFDDFDGSLEDF